MKIKPSDSREWYNQNGDGTYRINYNLNENSIVVDLGARHGDWASLIREKYNSKIFCFEIVEEFYLDLKNKGYNTFRYAVIDKDGEVSIGIEESEASIYNNNKIFTVQSIAASNIFKLINEVKIDLLKINVEGAEYPILENLIETGEINKIENIQVQFHLFDGKENKQYDIISDNLNKTHYLTWRFPFVWENWKLKNQTQDFN
jgi:FkbM family methyltransferase